MFYLSFVLTITVIERVPDREAQHKLELFWSYKAIMAGNAQLLAENFWNVVLFLPIGVLISGLLPRCRVWLAVWICAAGSAAVEVAQLVTHRGLFEFDDTFHNTLILPVIADVFLHFFMRYRKFLHRFLYGFLPRQRKLLAHLDIGLNSLQ